MKSTPAERDTERPELIVLDVNETLSDLSGLEEAFGNVGLDHREVPVWFAGVLRDAFALTVLGDNPSFADIGMASMLARLRVEGAADPEAGAAQVMDRLASLRPHGDVVPGLLALAGQGCRIVTLSNGSAEVARALLRGTEAGPVIEHYLSVVDAGVWKPAAGAYAYALQVAGVPATSAMLVAAHPWDIEGAHRAGLRTAWIGRGRSIYPGHFTPAEVETTSLVDLAAVFAQR